MSEHAGPRNISIVDHGDWERAIATANPTFLLLQIEDRLGPSLRGRLSADDILQDALGEGWRSRESFRGDAAAFRAWLLRIVEHRIVSVSRRESALKRGGAERVGPLADGSRVGPATPGSCTPSRLAWFRERAGATRAAFDSLPEELRVVVWDRLVERRTIGEIGDALGLTASMVRARLRRGSELLRTRLLGALGASITRYGPNPTDGATKPEPNGSS